jgi:hypothetical protein
MHNHRFGFRCFVFIHHPKQRRATPFLLAAQCGDVTMLKLLHKYGADVHPTHAVDDEAHGKRARLLTQLTELELGADGCRTV